jgi:chromosomal replication initiation ATPase DnaA
LNTKLVKASSGNKIDFLEKDNYLPFYFIGSVGTGKTHTFEKIAQYFDKSLFIPILIGDLIPQGQNSPQR